MEFSMGRVISAIWLCAAGLGCGVFDMEYGNPCAVACGPCPPALTLTVSLADGATPQDVYVDMEGPDVQWDCTESGNQSVCSVHVAAGHVSLAVVAPGYERAPMALEIPVTERAGCCSCDYDPQAREVVLQRR